MQLGNFTVDLIRSIVYLLLPISVVFGLVLISQGMIQNFSAYLHITSLEGAAQIIPMGPVASQEVIKELGTNGGGFFNANSAHPFENPNAAHQFSRNPADSVHPGRADLHLWPHGGQSAAGLGDTSAAMAILFLAGVLSAYAAESQPNPALAGLPLDQSAGNLEGKEVRFGVANSALFATATTGTSCGAVNSMHDSFNPLGGMVPLVNRSWARWYLAAWAQDCTAS